METTHPVIWKLQQLRGIIIIGSGSLSQTEVQPPKSLTGLSTGGAVLQVLADDNMATKLLFIGAMTGELGEAYKILMLGGVNVRFSGLTRELQAEVWKCIHKVPY